MSVSSPSVASTPGTGYRILQLVSTLELLSLVVILTNRFMLQSPAITSTGGPVHGLLYISTILLAVLLPLPRPAKWLAVVPGFGGILALTVARRRRTTAAVAPVRAAVERHVTSTGLDAVVHSDGFIKELSRTVTIGPLDFAVPAGRITGLIGPNGAGKTTTLRAIAGLVAPTSGSISIRGRSPHTDPGVLQSVGVLIEGPAFVDSLSAIDNLLVLTRLAEWPDDTAERALARVGLADLASRRVSTFSLGMRQRLGLAAALLGDPALVILDEPTNGLDPQGSEALRRLLLELAAAGTTVIVSSHILTDIEQVCAHLVVLAAGRVVFEGAPDELSSLRPQTVRYRLAPNDTGGSTRLSEALTARGLTVTEEDAGEYSLIAEPGVDSTAINRLAIDLGVVLAELRTVRPALQDTFFELTGRPDTGIGLNPVLETAGAPR